METATRQLKSTYHVGTHQVTDQDIVYVARLGTQITSHSNPMCAGIEPGSTVTTERWETARGDLFCSEHCIDHLTFGQKLPAPESAAPAAEYDGPTQPAAARPAANVASEKQMAFITILMDQRNLTGDPTAILFPSDNGASRRDGQLTKREASQLIDLLKGLPIVAQPEALSTEVAPITGLDLTGLPTGHYAAPGGDTRLKVHVSAPQKGKWAGWVFVTDGAEYGSQQRYGSQRPGAAYKGSIEDQLRAIITDPQAAMAAYGHLTSTCGACGRTLEDEASVARGIGPVCATKMGW